MAKRNVIFSETKNVNLVTVRRRSTFNILPIDRTSSHENHGTVQQPIQNNQIATNSLSQDTHSPITRFLHSSGNILKKTFSFCSLEIRDEDEPIEMERTDETRSQQATENNSNKEHFHISIRWILKTAQVFGLLPVRGILEQDPNKLEFNLISFRVVYTTLFLICLLAIETLAMVELCDSVQKHGSKVLKNLKDVAGATLFYGNAFIATFLFLKLASRWKTMILNYWYEVENNVKDFKFCNLTRRFSLMAAFIMVFALVDHILSLRVNYEKAIGNMRDGSDLFEEYMKESHPFIFKNSAFIKYNPYLGGIITGCCTIATFIWNFTDLFVILISMGLSQHFVHFNDCVYKARQNASEREWKNLRLHYHSLSTLVKNTDKEISGIVLLSFMNDTCWIGLQLLNVLIRCNNMERVYFSVSFLFLLVRTIILTRYAARIHEESRACLLDIYSCPSENYCIELQRLETFVVTDEIAITGLRIFPVTRNFIFVVCGCIFTFTVVLMQFYIALNGENTSHSNKI